MAMQHLACNEGNTTQFRLSPPGLYTNQEYLYTLQRPNKNLEATYRLLVQHFHYIEVVLLRGLQAALKM